MSLVKWFRKNNKKVMAVVVIVIMFGFIGGSYLSSLGRRGPKPKETIAHFLDDRKMTRSDRQLAQQQLDILSTLRAGNWLRAQYMQGILLGELLFAERAGRNADPQLVGYIRRTIAQQGFRISSKDIEGLYDRTVPPDIIWLLLKHEAHNAGLTVSTEDAANVLAKLIPQLYSEVPGITYKQLITQLVNSGTSENRVLAAFADLLGIFQYAHWICSTEDTTIRQIMHTASKENETIGLEFVRLDTAVFAKGQPKPNNNKSIEHFSKFKAFKPGQPTPQNPHGFGYKLHDRVRLEYIAVKRDDIESIIEQPTHEQTEEYYRRKQNSFSWNVPSDPNDPDSPLVKKIRSYAEVVDSIKDQLRIDRIDAKTQSILIQAKLLTEPNLAGTDLDIDQLTAEQFTEKARDYAAAAEQLRKEYKIEIYTGRTGLMNAVDMQMDKYAGGLSNKGFGYYPVSLAQIVFAVDELGASQLGPFDAPKPKMYQNIGPFEDPYAAVRAQYEDSSEQFAAIARVIEAVKATEPDSIDQTFETHSFVFDPNDLDDEENVYSVREKVTEDLKKLAAVRETGVKAREFLDLASKTSWDDAVDKFNELYGEPAKDDPNDPNFFRIDNLPALTRTSALRMRTFAAQNQGGPAADFVMNRIKIEKELADKLYALVPPDSNTPKILPLIMEFKPDLSFFCIKNLTVKRLYKEQFNQMKIGRFGNESLIQLQSLAPIHFNPQNILTRMKFKPVEDDEESADPNEPDESEAETQ